MTDDKRSMLRHLLATIVYRGDKYLANAPASVGTYGAGESGRTPVEILSHINGLLLYARSFLTHCESTRPQQADWDAEVKRFHELAAELDEVMARGTPVAGATEEQLLQGPLSDILVHLGQISILERLAGFPPPDDENYVHAPIRIPEAGAT